MSQLYTFAIHLYAILVQIVAPFNPKAKKWILGRKNLWEEIASAVEPGYIIWIHASSVGEFEQARPLIERIKKDYPLKKILVTFYSPSAYELRKNYELADYIFYLPLDTPKNARKFLDLVQPEMVFFVKYEFWYNFIVEIHNRHITLYLISGIFRSSQYFFKWYGGWFRKQLKYFNQLFIQDNHSASLLEKIQISTYTVNGDTRFDRVYSNTQNPRTFEAINTFTSSNPILLCGSTWSPDETMLLEYIKTTKTSLKLIIAPHEIHSDHILNLKQLFSDFNPILWSELHQSQSTDHSQLLIIDSVGILMHLYQYADVAYVGGGFGVGIHNILEAACFGKPIVFGPKYQKFKEAQDLIQAQGAFSIQNQVELNISMDKLFNNQDFKQVTSEICVQYVKNNIGATEVIYNHCF